MLYFSILEFVWPCEQILQYYFKNQFVSGTNFHLTLDNYSLIYIFDKKQRNKLP